MFKKLSACVLALAVVAGVSAPVQAQDVIGVYFDDAVDGLQRFGTTDAGPWDIVVQTTLVNSSSASEFVVTEILLDVPSMFKTGTAKIFNRPGLCRARSRRTGSHFLCRLRRGHATRLHRAVAWASARRQPAFELPGRYGLRRLRRHEVCPRWRAFPR